MSLPSFVGLFAGSPWQARQSWVILTARAKTIVLVARSARKYSSPPEPSSDLRITVSASVGVFFELRG
jgi:hypothetical protein